MTYPQIGDKFIIPAYADEPFYYRLHDNDDAIVEVIVTETYGPLINVTAIGDTADQWVPVKALQKTPYSEERRAVVLALDKALKEAGDDWLPHYERRGLCANLEHVARQVTGLRWEGADASVDALLKGAFKAWPNFSGNYHAPIPAPEGYTSETSAIEYYFSQCEKWDRSKKHGQERWELFEHVRKFIADEAARYVM